MGTIKQYDFNKEINEIAETCRALGHPTRMQIIALLNSKNNRTCGEIVKELPLAQSTVSKHLLELKKAALLTVTNKGKQTIYSIENDRIQLLRKNLSNYISNSKKFSENIVKNDFANEKNKTNPSLKKYNYQFPTKDIDTTKKESK